jgi:hypothetical protein
LPGRRRKCRKGMTANAGSINPSISIFAFFVDGAERK